MNSGLFQSYLESSTLQFEDISLKEAIAIDLNTRKELKFILSVEHFFRNMPELQKKFRIQKNALDLPFNSYATRYWDTESKDFFKDHIRGRNNRIKIRKRKYEDTGDVMLEIKRKLKGKTIKKRTPSTFTLTLSESDEQFLEENKIKIPGLTYALDTQYKRITLWDKEMQGRITVDFDYGVGLGDTEHTFNKACILECKGNDKFLIDAVKSFETPLFRYKHGFSKYAIGIIHQYNMGPESAKGLLSTYKMFRKIN